MPVLAMLLVVLLVAGVALWRARRNGLLLLPAGRRARLRVVERLALARNTALLVVDYDGRHLLIGQSGDRLSLIDAASGAGERRPEHDAR